MFNQPPLTLTEAEMRHLGYQIVDMLVEHFSTVQDKPVTRTKDRATLALMLDEPPPEDGQNLAEILQCVRDDIFSSIRHLDHPRFFSFVPSPNNFVSVMGDALASGFNVFAGVFLESSAAAQIELTVLDWLRKLCSFPDSAGGVLVSGGSVANLTALAAARHSKLGHDWSNAVIYCSDQTHSSIVRAVDVLGFQPNQLRRIPSDGHFCLTINSLLQAIQHDRKNGNHPFCVVANAGTTNTGAVDPLSALADLCCQENLWFHIDGAYGASAVLTQEGKVLLKGLERADSLSLDPHKWLFQPFEIGCVLLRDRSLLGQTFHILPEYLKIILGEDDEVNFCDYGLQLTRGFRALKLWMSIKAFGLHAFREAIETGLENARLVEARLRKAPVWEVVTPASLGVVTFRYHVPGNSESVTKNINLAISERIVASGFAMVMTTELKGKTVLRICPINPRTTRQDIENTIEKLELYGMESIPNVEIGE